jgi:ankyrin repeat protein
MTNGDIDLSSLSASEIESLLSSPDNVSILHENRWYGMTHLHEACIKGLEDHLRVFIQHGADVNVQNMGGETPFHLAARRGLISISERLRIAGASTNVCDKSGKDPREGAVQ